MIGELWDWEIPLCCMGRTGSRSPCQVVFQFSGDNWRDCGCWYCDFALGLSIDPSIMGLKCVKLHKDYSFSWLHRRGEWLSLYMISYRLYAINRTIFQMYFAGVLLCVNTDVIQWRAVSVCGGVMCSFPFADGLRYGGLPERVEGGLPGSLHWHHPGPEGRPGECAS